MTRQRSATSLARSSWFWCSCALACGLLAAPNAAFAYSDPASFGLPALLAGGAGRYFTGSPADGYTCKACHQGGREPTLSVLGLPTPGYVPGSRYEISIVWPLNIERFAAAVEITDARGKPAGSVRLPPLSESQVPEFCEPASDGLLAASISAAPNARQVINVPDCGSRRLRFLWTAPATDVGPAWFSGSAVWSDGEADAYHDGVTDFGRVVASPSAPALASLTTQGCSVSNTGSAQTLPRNKSSAQSLPRNKDSAQSLPKNKSSAQTLPATWAGGVALSLLVWLRRRQRRRASRCCAPAGPTQPNASVA